MAGHGRHPGVGFSAAPVGKAAVGVLPGVQCLYNLRYKFLCGLFVGFGEHGHQGRHGNASGAELLTAAVRIVFHIQEHFPCIQGGEARKLEGGSCGNLTACTLFNNETLHGCHLRIWILNSKGNGFGSLVAGAGGFYRYMRHAFTFRLQAETYHLVALPAETHLLRGGSRNGCRAVGLDANRHVLHALFHCKHVHRNGYFLSGAKDAGQCGYNH